MLAIVKKSVSMFLAVLMVLTLCPVAALAEGTADETAIVTEESPAKQEDSTPAKGDEPAPAAEEQQPAAEVTPSGDQGGESGASETINDGDEQGTGETGASDITDGGDKQGAGETGEGDVILGEGETGEGDVVPGSGETGSADITDGGDGQGTGETGDGDVIPGEGETGDGDVIPGEGETGEGETDIPTEDVVTEEEAKAEAPVKVDVYFAVPDDPGAVVSVFTKDAGGNYTPVSGGPNHWRLYPGSYYFSVACSAEFYPINYSHFKVPAKTDKGVVSAQTMNVTLTPVVPAEDADSNTPADDANSGTPVDNADATDDDTYTVDLTVVPEDESDGQAADGAADTSKKPDGDSSKGTADASGNSETGDADASDDTPDTTDDLGEDQDVEPEPEPEPDPFADDEEEIIELDDGEADYDGRYTGKYISAKVTGKYMARYGKPGNLKSGIGGQQYNLTILDSVVLDGLATSMELKLTAAVRNMPTVPEGQTLAFYALKGNHLSNLLKADLSQGSRASITLKYGEATGVALVLMPVEEAPVEEPAEQLDETAPVDELPTDTDPEAETVGDPETDLETDPDADQTPAVYTVTFMNGETDVDSRQVADGEAVGALPEEPVSEDDVPFAGWFFGDEFVTADTIVTGDMVVEARFEFPMMLRAAGLLGAEGDPNEYIVTFIDGEESTTVSIPIPDEGDDALLGELPKAKGQEGARFDGWYNGETKATAETIITGNTTFTAKYIPIYTVTFNPNTEEGDQLAPITIEVAEGEAIGSQLPVVPSVSGYNTKWVNERTSEEVTADTVVTEAFTAVVGKDKIVYTVTFVQEDGTTETRTTSIDEAFAINDLPEVTPKTNKVGKWVYQGTNNEFTVGTIISQDLIVEAKYEQNIFTVTFMVDGAQYEQMTTATGTTIVLPSDPVKSGATFEGWFTEEGGQGTQYTAESKVNSDLTLYAYFAEQVRVSFLVKDDKGNVISEKSQFFVDLNVGDQITTMPDDPFVEGKVFDHWKNETNGDIVEAGYTVAESFNAVAVFKPITAYKLTVHYYYMNEGNQVDIGTRVYELVDSDLENGYSVTAPQSAVVDLITGEDLYYPSIPTITVDEDGFNGVSWTLDEENNVYTLTVQDEYVDADFSYTVNHYLKDLTGDGYTTLIESESKVGVQNTSITPDAKNYPYADYDHRDVNVPLSGDNVVANVYYNRRNFTLSYNVSGGDYIESVTAPYGTAITLPTDATRAGYTFDGWYTDADCTQSAGASFTLAEDTVLYAKWNPSQVEYKIVYLIENADDDGYSYLATVTKQAATGSTVTMTAQTAGANGTRPSDLDTTNFTFKDSTTETIKADSTTVVTVRYSRNVYTLQGRTGTGYGASNIQGATVTAKYGADITTAFAQAFNAPNPGYGWSYDNNNNHKFSGIDVMPSLDVRSYGSGNTIYLFRHEASTTRKQVLYYWLENYDGTSTKVRNGRTYGLVKQITVQFQYLKDGDDFYDITGYTKDGYTATNAQGQTVNYTIRGANSGTGGTTPNYELHVNFFYRAAQYPLTFYNYDGTLISKQQVTLNSNIYSYLTGNIPAAPMDGATWKGWYTDAQHSATSLYSYNQQTKMPAGLVLYGDFQFPTRTVSFDTNGGSTNPASQTDEYGFYASMPEDPTREGYVFQGWFTAVDEAASPYDWNSPVTEDITLYAHWKQKTLRYTVHYYEWDSENEAPTTNPLLPDKEMSNPDYVLNQEITENAQQIVGYVAKDASLTKNLSFNDEDNVFIFYYYTVPSTLTYTVNYVLKDNPEIKVAESKTFTVPGTTTMVTEMPVEVDKAYLAEQTDDADILGMHYKPSESSKQLQLALENNVITFEYIPYTTVKITVNYFDMDGNTINPSDTSYVEKGDTFTLQNKAPDGFVYHHAYLDGTTTAPQPVYQITGEEGDLVINIYYQKKLIILANNKSKTYDGTALSSSFDVTTDYTITGIARGDTVTSLAFDGSQTNAGTSATTPKNAQITLGTTGTTAPEQYYSIIYVPGSLTVKPVSVYISISADQWNTHSGSTGGPNYYTGQTFNVGFTNPGKQHFNDTPGSAYVSITSGQRALFKAKYGDAIWSALYGTNGALISKKDAGTYTVSGAEQRAIVAGVTVGGQNIMSDPNYSITLYARDSFLVIEPLPITITTPSDEKGYDGTALTKSEGATLDHSYWTANIGGVWTAAQTAAPGSVTLGTGDTITFTVNGSQTEVGESDNMYEIEWGSANSNNYKITANLGTLKVTTNNNEVTLTAPSDEKVYDGTKLTCDGTGEKKVTATGLPEGFTVEATASGFATHVNEEGKNVVNDGYVIKNAQGVDVTDLFTNVKKEDGKLTINPATLTITTQSDSKKYDGNELTAEGSITGFVNDETATFEVTGSQTLVGSSENSYSLVWDGTAVESDYTLSKELGTLTVTDENVDPSLVVTKNDGQDDNYEYKEGETVTFTITVKNIYAVAKTITLSEIEGVTLTQETFENVTAGETVSTTATYVIKPADMAAGSFTNTVTATLEGKTYQASDTVNTEEADAAIKVEKSAALPEGKTAYEVGDTITYTVVVTNTGNVSVKDGTLADDHADLSDKTFALAPGKTAEFTYTYTATQADVDAGTIKNTVKANAKDPKDEAVKEAEASATVNAVDVDVKLTVNKKITNTPEDGEAYKLGETIEYEITVTNDGNVTYTNVVVKDEDTGLNETIATLAVGATETFTTSHVVTEEDILAGSYTNTVTAKGDPINGKTPEGEDSVTTGAEDDPDGPNPPIEEKNGHLKITKVTTSTAEAADGKYVLYEEITYKITVTNDGNLTITDIVITDELTGDSWNIKSLAPGESKEFETSYTVTETDVKAGEVVNVATGTGKSPDPDEPDVPVDPGKDPEPTGLRKDLTVDSENVSVKYDGASHSVTGTSNVSDALIEFSTDGTTWSTSAPTRTDVGKVTFFVRASRDGYETVQKDGFTLEVTPRQITLTSASASKWYDGTALWRKVVTVSSDGFVDGEGATYNVTGSQTEVGSSKNTFTYKLNANTKAGNYVIVVVYGTLRVLEQIPEEEVPLASLAGLGNQFGECFE